MPAQNITEESEPRSLADIIAEAMAVPHDHDRTTDALTVRSFPNLPGYTPRLGAEHVVVTVSQAKAVIAALTRRGISWNSVAQHGEPGKIAVFISFDAQTFGATLDPTLTIDNLYWDAFHKDRRITADLNAAKADLELVPETIKLAMEQPNVALRQRDLEEIDDARTQTEGLIRRLKEDVVTARQAQRTFQTAPVSPTVRLKAEVQTWAKNNLDHPVTIAGTFEKPTIRFMSGNDRSEFLAKFGGRSLAE